ncbi:MAG: Type 1 glutamine amidotransferase-like domain-containing protein [Bacteriovorax sp.]|nr:Type 1 glutamine amidotransferase-like domain-containing protein [Bacteriovorax sp.]
MKLVFISGGSGEDNFYLNQRALALTNVKKPKLSFIPSSSDVADVTFKSFVKEFSMLGRFSYNSFCVDAPYSQSELVDLLQSDLIYLGGGNTFHFLHHLKKNHMFGHLQEFLKKDGVLCGLSAGAIVLSPNINTANFPSFDRDENLIGLKNLKGMGLVNFEFFPHYTNAKRYSDEFVAYTEKSKFPFYASFDGSGIIIEDKHITFWGKNYLFYQGKKIIVSDCLS